jgi:phasin family protein
MTIEKFSAPVKALNELAIANFEKLAALQLSFAEKSVKVGVESLKSASAVTDLEGLKAFYTTQSEVAKGLVEDVVASSTTVAEIGKAYAEDAKGIVESAVAA